MLFCRTTFCSTYLKCTTEDTLICTILLLVFLCFKLKPLIQQSHENVKI